MTTTTVPPLTPAPSIPGSTVQNFWCSPELRARLRTLAMVEHRTVSAMIVKLLDEALEQRALAKAPASRGRKAT